MRRTIAIVLLMLAAEASAAAQTTNCMNLGGGMVHCDTIGPQGSASTDCTQMGQMAHCDTMQMEGGNTGAARSTYQDDSGAALGAGIAALIKKNRERAFEKHMTKLIEAGDCQGAAKYALDKGRLELGQAITRACAAPPASVGPAQDIEARLARAASMAVTPASLGNGFTVTRVEAVGKQLLLTATSDQLTELTSQVRNGTVKETCAASDFLPVLRAGGSLRTVFIGAGGKELGSVLVAASECGLQ